MIMKNSVASITQGLTKMATQLENLIAVEENKQDKAQVIIDEKRDLIVKSADEIEKAGKVRKNLLNILGE